MIQVIMCPVGRPPYVTNISDKLETMQRTVGGYIETVSYPIEGCVVVCNEEGRLRGLPENPSMPGFVGDVFICGTNGEEFADIDQKIKKLWLAQCKENYRRNTLW